MSDEHLDSEGDDLVIAPIMLEYERVIDALIDDYRRLDRAANHLPLFSAMSLLNFTCLIIISQIAIMADFYLIVPINAIILIRNIFPGRWRYKCWTWKYLKVAGICLWRGDCLAA